MQRKNEGRNSTQSKIRAIRELQKSISGKQFLENTPNPDEPTFETNCITESSPSPQRVQPVLKTDLRKSPKNPEYLTETTSDFSYSRNYKAKKMIKDPSTDLTKSIVKENRPQVLRVEIENISESISLSHGDQTSRLPTRNISIRELPSSKSPSKSPSPIYPTQLHATNNNPDCAILFDSIVIDESIVVKNKPRSKLLMNRIESSFSKSKLPPAKKPKPNPVPQTESLQKNPVKFNPPPILPPPTFGKHQTPTVVQTSNLKLQQSTFLAPDKSGVHDTDL